MWKTNHEAGLGRALEITGVFSATELRALPSREKKNRTARRMLRPRLDPMSRAEAARVNGMER